MARDEETIVSPAGKPVDPLESVFTKGAGKQGKGQKGKKVDPNKLWYIHGKAYDLTDFVYKHPGGPTVLLNTQGRDMTALFEAFHPFTDRPHNLLAKMKEVPVGAEVLKEKCTDISQGNWFYLPDGTPDPFWQALKERCGKYMREHKETRDMKWSTFLLHVFLLAIQPALWWFGYCNAYPWTSHGTAVLMAVTYWIGGRLGHDGGHFAVSRNYWVNRIVGNWAGLGLSNISYWEILHNVDHHIDTNTDKDPDLYHYLWFLRDTPSYPWSFFHRFQVARVYCYGVWSFTTAGLLIFEPLNMLFTGSGTRPPTLRLHHSRFFFWFKLVWHVLFFMAMMLGIPMWLNWETSPSKLAVFGVRFASFTLYLMITGLLFGMFSQVNHFSQDCVAAAHRNTSWATRQVETAANFCIQSPFWSLITAGIHIQIEHHLFPGISSDKLLPLCPIVEETCKEFGVNYKRFDTFGSILNSVHSYIDTLAYPNATTTSTTTNSNFVPTSTIRRAK